MAKSPLSILPDSEDKEIESGLPSASPNKHWLDTVLESPVFAGVLAMIALAIGFSPRASTLGTWVCLGAAWILLIRMVYTLEPMRMKARGLRWKITGVVSAGGLIAFTAFGLWLMQPLKSAIAAVAQTSSTPDSRIAQTSPSPVVTLSPRLRRSVSPSSPTVEASPRAVITNSSPPVIPLTGRGLDEERSIGFPNLSTPDLSPVSPFVGLQDIGVLRCQVINVPRDLISHDLSKSFLLPMESSYISDAMITARNIQTDREYSGTTDIIGHLSLIVPYGSYQLMVTAPGYRQVDMFQTVEVKQFDLNSATLHMSKVETATATPNQ